MNKDFGWWFSQLVAADRPAVKESAAKAKERRRRSWYMNLAVLIFRT